MENLIREQILILSCDVEQALRATAFPPDAVWDPDWMMLWFLLVPVP